jgi:hypothetical protein
MKNHPFILEGFFAGQYHCLPWAHRHKLATGLHLAVFYKKPHLLVHNSHY